MILMPDQSSRFPVLQAEGRHLADLLNITGNASPEQLQELLDKYYVVLRQHFLDRILQHIHEFMGEEYSKLILFETQTSFGRLAFDWIQFGYQQPTGVHLHSDYVIEELFSGELVEQTYALGKDGRYHFDSEEFRRPPACFRSEYDPSGKPHCVTALMPQTWGLCLHFGHRGVTFISPDLIGTRAEDLK